MKFSAFTFFMVCLLITNAQKDTIPYRLLKEYKSQKMWLGDKPVSGLVSQGEVNNVISYTEYKDGWKNGTSTHFYLNGQKRAEGEYFNNKEHKKWTFWDSTGVKIQEGSYNEGKRVGRWYMLYQNEEMEVICYYSENRLHGNYLKRKTDGKVLEEGAYDKGVIIGEWRYWKESTQEYITSDKGNLALDPSAIPAEVWRSNLKFMEGKWHYKNVPYTGKIFEHFRNGQPSYEAELIDGCYLWETQHHGNGQLKSDGKYKNCQKTGKWVSYYEDGSIAKQEVYRDGKLDDYFVEYREGGLISREAHYKNSQLNGWYRTYQVTKNGNAVKWEAEYKDGELHGIQRSYDDNGEPIHQRSYTHNKLNGLSLSYQNEPTKQLMKESKVVESWTFYDKIDGQLKVYFKAEDGIKNGIYQEFNPDGSWKIKGQYLDGKENGTWEIFLRNSPYRIYVSYENGRPVDSKIDALQELSTLFIYENDLNLRAVTLSFKSSLIQGDTSGLYRFFADTLEINGKKFSAKEAVQKQHLFHPTVMKKMAFALETGFKEENGSYQSLAFKSPDMDSLFHYHTLTFLIPNAKLYLKNHPDAATSDPLSSVYYGNYQQGCINDENAYSGCWFEIYQDGKKYYVKEEDIFRGDNALILQFKKLGKQWKLVGIKS